MINLLPPEEKEKLFLKKKERLVTILGITVLVSLICLILILSSIKLYIEAEAIYQKIVLEQTEKKYQTPDFLNFKDTIQKYNKIVIQLKNFYNQKQYSSQSLKIISDIQRPEGIYLTGLSLNNDENKKIKVTATGISDSRENLLIYKKNIEENKKIENLYFSPETWINPENINFSLTFEISDNDI
jgi:hypothetical protein